MLVAGLIGQLSQKYMTVADRITAGSLRNTCCLLVEKMFDFLKGGCWRKHRLRNQFPKKETRGVTLECTGGGLLTGVHVEEVDFSHK